MARNRKTVLKNFSYLQCDDFAAYLSQMAAKGWHRQTYSRDEEEGITAMIFYTKENEDGSVECTLNEIYVINYGKYGMGFLSTEELIKSVVGEDIVFTLILENNIVNPLSQRNMIRSSQATNMYNNLAQTNAGQISNFTNDLLANSQAETANVLTKLMLMYMSGYNAISDTQKQSLETSQGNATTTHGDSQSGMSSSDIMQMALQVAMMAAGF